jgi:hypothetical protein
MTKFNGLAVLSSPQSLKSFLFAPEALQELRTNPTSPKYEMALPTRKVNLSGRWCVCQLITVPIRFLLEGVLNLIGFLVSFFDLDAGRYLGYLADRVSIGFNYDNDYLITKLVTTRNAPNSQGKMVQQHPKIPLSQIQDPVVQSFTRPKDNGVAFGTSQGMCLGTSEWFMGLYHLTKSQFSSPREHMIALTNLFKEGAPPQATLLQYLRPTAITLLNYNYQAYVNNKNDAVIEMVRVGREVVPKDEEQAIKTFYALEKGIYEIGTPNHAMVFLKVNNEHAFVMDPNRGLFELKGPGLAEKFLSIIYRNNQQVPNMARFNFTFDLARPLVLPHAVPMPMVGYQPWMMAG